MKQKNCINSVALLTICLNLTSLAPLRAEEKLIFDIPNYPPAGWSSKQYMTLALSYKNVGEPEKARASLKLAIKKAKNPCEKQQAEQMLSSEVPRYPVPEAANRMNNLAFNEMAHQHLSKAISAFEQCAAEYPKYETPLNSLSSIYLIQKKPVEARDFAQRALAINPHSSNAWLNLGNSYLLQNDYKKARICGEKSLQCYCENKNAAQMLNYIRVKKGGARAL